MISMGIDPSTKMTGLVILQANGTKIPDLVFHEMISNKEPGMKSHVLMATRIMELIGEYSPDKIVIEGYSLNMQNKTSVVPLVELGGIIRLMFHLDGLKWLDPRAGQLKLFVTGKGNDHKDKVMMMVLHHWGYVAEVNDMADAYGLACIGLAHSGKLIGATLSMLKVAGELKFNSW